MPSIVGIGEGQTFSKGISPKVNVTAGLDLELTHNVLVVIY